MLTVASLELGLRPVTVYEIDPAYFNEFKADPANPQDAPCPADLPAAVEAMSARIMALERALAQDPHANQGAKARHSAD